MLSVEKSISIEDLSLASKRVQEAIRTKMSAMKGGLMLSEWMASGVDQIRDDPKVSLPSTMEPSQLPFTWSSRDVSKVFTANINVPKSYFGLDLTGSRAEIELWCLIGAEITVNGQKAYDVDYWADTQVVPLVLADSIQEEEDFHVVIRCKQGDGFGLFLQAELCISQVEDWLLELDTFGEEIGFLTFLVQQNEITDPHQISQLYDAVVTFPLDLLESDSWLQLGEVFSDIRTKLSMFEPVTKQYRIHLAGHAHIDMNWLWPWSETVDLIRRDFESMVSIMEEYPEVHFSHSQAVTYEVVKKQFPELWSRMKALVERGQWEITAATWVEGDLNMAGYESLPRQFLEANLFLKEEFGHYPDVCWEPDTFGHPATIPQLLVDAGIHYYYHMRAGRNVPVFWWEGLDGSQVLVFNEPGRYNGRVFASEMVPVLKDLNTRYGVKNSLYVFGIGDHGGGVTRKDVLRAGRLAQSPLLPSIEFSTVKMFFDDLVASGCKFPTIRGELNSVFEGCYTSHGDVKRANRATEHALVSAEVFSTMANLARGVSDDAVDSQFREAWRRHCFNQFHDIVCGCAIGSTYEEAVPAAAAIREQAETSIQLNLQSLVDSDSSDLVTIFNSLSWDRLDVVCLDIREFPTLNGWQTGDKLESTQGHVAFVQRDGDKVYWIARVPALGFTSYRFIAGQDDDDTAHRPEPIEMSIKGNPVLYSLEFKLEIDRTSGSIISLQHIDSRREMTRSDQQEHVEAAASNRHMNVFELHYEAPHTMSAWQIGDVTSIQRLVRGATLSNIESGPVFQTVKVTHNFGSSRVVQRIRVYRGLNRVDFDTEVDWNEVGSDTSDAAMLRVSFSPDLWASTHRFDVPLGSIERNPNGQEGCAIHWIDVSEDRGPDSFGMSLLNNGKYGHAIHGSTMSITLLRSSYEPDNFPDRGQHQFTYSLLPHRFGWKEANTVQAGLEVNQPIRAALGGPIPSLLDFGSMFRVEEMRNGVWESARGVIVTSVKSGVSENRWLVLRLLEIHGEAKKFRLISNSSIAEVWRFNILEEPQQLLVSNSDSTCSKIGVIGAHEVMTLGLKMGQSKPVD